ncbi:MAG: 2-oxo acid dehydrogenase subunit E2 [Leptospiraceae bacterium]|nr:2-oxo acid dehydrogenase subunit E2 [Leptospiraceae bacterium]
MAKLIELTQLSPTMSEGNFVRWTVNKGDSIDPGDVIAEVETDKAVMEMEALDSGILLATLAEEGDKLPVGAPLGVLGEMGEEISDLLEQAKKKLKEARDRGGQGSSEDNETSQSESSPSTSDQSSGPSQQAAYQDSAQNGAEQSNENSAGKKEGNASRGDTSGAATDETGGRKTSTRPSANVRVSSPEKPVLDAPAQNGLIALPGHRILYKKSKAGVRATPLARKIAREKGVDLSLIEATGRGGSVTEEDVNRFQKSAASSGPGIEARPDRKIELSNMRKVIASRLHDAKNNIPHFYLTVEYRADAILNLRESLNRDLQNMVQEGEEAHKFSLNDLITRAVALSLARHPVVNSSWRENHVLEHGRIDIGVAVAVEGGLITPYVRHADQISLMQLSKKTSDLVSRARSRKLKPEEFTNGTFTISNLGMFGIKEFSAIINEPEAALLAVGGIEEKPAAREGQIVIEKTITMTLSCDHRVVDGAEGARFLQTLKGFIENPHTLIVGS